MAASDRLLLRIPEVASALGLSRTVIYELIGRHELPVIHIGRSVRIPADALERWVEEQTQRAEAAGHFDHHEAPR